MDSVNKINNKNKNVSENCHSKIVIPISERRGQKKLKFTLPITEEKEDTTIEHIKPLF